MGAKYLGGGEWTPRNLGAEQAAWGHQGAASFGTHGAGVSGWAGASLLCGVQALYRGLQVTETTGSSLQDSFLFQRPLPKTGKWEEAQCV